MICQCSTVVTLRRVQNSHHTLLKVWIKHYIINMRIHLVYGHDNVYNIYIALRKKIQVVIFSTCRVRKRFRRETEKMSEYFLYIY